MHIGDNSWILATLFRPFSLSTPKDFYTILFWAYLMKVILETRHAHYIWFLRFYDYHWVETSDGGLLVLEVIIRPVVSALTLTWFIGPPLHTPIYS